MRHRFGPSLYFASDKVIFDALHHSQVTTELIRELFFERGVIVSSKTPKRMLAEYFSRLPSDYFDHQSIAEKLGKIASRERITYSELSGNLTQAQVLKAFAAVKAKLEADGDAVIIEVHAGRIAARIDYEVVDYTEMEFRQVQPRDGVIEFISDGAGKYVVRSTQNKFVDIALDYVVKELSIDPAATPKRTTISLEDVPSFMARTKFFDDLIKGIEGYPVVTVTDAFCYKPKGGSDDAEDQPQKDLEDQPNVIKVSLKGTDVINSPLAGVLFKAEYYIVKVVWRVKSNKSVDADIVELEAQFSEPATCTGFSYQVRTVLMTEDGALTGKKRPPKSGERDELLRLLESAAKKAMISAGA